jgi:hypothetical protein
MASVHWLWASSARGQSGRRSRACWRRWRRRTWPHRHCRPACKFQRLEPLVQRFEAQRLGNALDGFGQQGRSFLEAAGGDQQAHIVKARIVVGRVGRQRIGQLLQRRLGVAGLQQGLGFVGIGLGRQLALGGQMLVQELAQLALGLGAHEAVHGLAADHQHAGRDGADAEHAGQLLLLIESILTSLKRPS